jgi:hypothetical protein
VTGFWIGVAISVITSAVVNEFCDISPWLARRVMRRAALLWAATDSALADGYVVEWASVLEDCPGKISKLVLALRFLLGAASTAIFARVRRIPGDVPITRSWWWNEGFLARLSAFVVFASTVASMGFVLFGAVPAIVITGIAATSATATASIISIRSRARASQRMRIRAGDRSLASTAPSA